MRHIYRKKGQTLDELISFKKGKFFLQRLDGIFYPVEGLRDDISHTVFLDKLFNESLCFYKPSTGDTILDLGAGLGEEALLYSKMVGDRGKVIAIEPHPDTYAVLCEMVKKNSLKNVIALQYAIGPENGKLKISTPVASYESAYTGKEGLEVNAITLAALVKKFDLQTIHLLKSNIEGAERYLFENENGFAPGRIKNIAIACHDFRFKKEKNDFFQTKEMIKTALGKAGFEIHQRNTGIDYLDDWIYGSAKFS
jgi:FkbM family methyltransferase